MPITSLQGLLKRTQEIAKEQGNLLFDEMPYSFDLGMGWYPGRMLMAQEVEGRLRDHLPDLTGIVIPYYKTTGELSHLVVCEVSIERRLNRKKRAVIVPKPRNGKVPRLKGVFGLKRITEGHKTIQICQSELVAARVFNGVALSVSDRDLARFLSENTAKVDLVGETRDWYDEFVMLSRGGCEVTMNGRTIAEHYHAELHQMVLDSVGTSAMAARIQDVLKRLMPADAVALLAQLEATTKFDFSKLLPGDMRIFRNEREFYDLVAKELGLSYFAKLAGQSLVVLDSDNRTVYAGPAAPELLGHMLAADLGYLDMLEWAQENLKDVPHFYLYHQERLEPRYQVSLRIAQVALTALLRFAIKPEVIE